MQIHFVKQFPWGEPSYFIEKIWAGFALNDFLWYNREGCWATEHYKEHWPYGNDSRGISSWWRPFMKVKPKIHTIREDLKDRWKPNKMIHFEQWTGKPYHSKCYNFAPLIPCMSTQRIRIECQGSHKLKDLGASVFIDNRFLSMNEIEILSQNDGFESYQDFFRWFNKDYSGKIIHWTDFNY